MFSWSPVTSDCLVLHYNILTSNCGSCPTTTTDTTVTCTDVPTNGSMCTFAVQTVVCGDIVGDSSDSVNVTTFLKEDEKDDAVTQGQYMCYYYNTIDLFVHYTFAYIKVELSKLWLS